MAIAVENSNLLALLKECKIRKYREEKADLYRSQSCNSMPGWFLSVSGLLLV